MASAEENSQRTWSIFAHLSSLSFLIGIPFGNILGPLVIWLIKKDEMPLVNEAGKESINFQISITIYSIIAVILTLVFIGFFLLAALIIANIILVVIASIKASNGEKFEYPFTIRLLK
ncbi:MAG: orotate phosphoribosyltransferase [Waddliaceae bacterium]|nr:orotate phosphoribosyltransferase [Waddliaceae bacterium]